MMFILIGVTLLTELLKNYPTSCHHTIRRKGGIRIKGYERNREILKVIRFTLHWLCYGYG